MAHFSLPDEPKMEAALRAKINTARLSAGTIEDRLYAVVDLELSAGLTEEERCAFSEMLEAQYRDGWGQDFEIQSILTAQGEELCARLYHDGLIFSTGEAAQPLSRCPSPEGQSQPIIIRQMRRGTAACLFFFSQNQ